MARPDGTAAEDRRRDRSPHLGAKLAVREEHGPDDGATAIIAIATENAWCVGARHARRREPPPRRRRLCGEDAADVGAEANRGADGLYSDPYRIARSLTLFAAAAAEVDAIDSVYTNFRDLEGLAAEAGRRAGTASSPKWRSNWRKCRLSTRPLRLGGGARACARHRRNLQNPGAGRRDRRPDDRPTSTSSRPNACSRGRENSRPRHSVTSGYRIPARRGPPGTSPQPASLAGRDGSLTLPVALTSRFGALRLVVRSKRSAARSRPRAQFARCARRGRSSIATGPIGSAGSGGREERARRRRARSRRAGQEACAWS